MEEADPSLGTIRFIVSFSSEQEIAKAGLSRQLIRLQNGSLGALMIWMIFISAGVALIQRFRWIIYIFGAFLIRLRLCRAVISVV